MRNSREAKVVLGFGTFLLIYAIVLLILSYLSVKGIVLPEIVEWGNLILGLLFSIPTILWCSVKIILFLKRCIKNLYSCGDKLFNELDYYNVRWGETNEHYYDMISIINFYYKEGGKVDTVVGKDLKRLYSRLEFLERGINTKEHMITCMTSIGLSICATVFFEYVFGKFEGQILCAILVIVLFFVVILFRYGDIFNESNNQIYKYEMSKLKEKITIAENLFTDDYQREDFLLTKQYVLRGLMDKCKSTHGNEKKSIVDDIRRIEKLNLNISTPDEYKELKFRVGKSDKEGVFFLDRNNDMVNEQYEILYEILRKYDWIYEINKDEEE